MKELIATLFLSFFLTGFTFGQKITADTVGEPSAKKLPIPEYPEAARKAGIQGNVGVRVTIDEKGKVVSAEASRVMPLCPSVVTPETVGLLNAAILSAKKATYGQSDSSRIGFIRYIFQLPNTPKNRSTGSVGARVAGISESEPTEVKMKLAITDLPDTVSGGVLNGKAIALPKPSYPAAARAIRATGTVEVQVVIAEDGTMYSAESISGHPLLRSSSEIAACGSRFMPTLLEGKPVKVAGIIKYNYVP